jgi:hypothetical protein
MRKTQRMSNFVYNCKENVEATWLLNLKFLIYIQN